jgi:hypothetical protein
MPVAGQGGDLKRYLQCENHLLTLEESQYGDAYKVTEQDGVTINTPSLGGLYINKQEINDTHSVPQQRSFFERLQGVPESRQFVELKDSSHFAALYDRWQSNTLILARVITGVHYTWEDLVSGKLSSEGTADIPTFTMFQGAGPGTCWLPTAFSQSNDHADLESIALGNLGQQQINMRNALEQMGTWFPAGIIVTIHPGTNKSFGTCWMNSGEIVVRGPLTRTTEDFKIWRIVYFNLSNGETRRVMPFRDDLLRKLPQRPWQPTEEEAENWIAQLIAFNAEVQAELNIDLNNPPNAS